MTNPQLAVANLLTPQAPAPPAQATAERKANALLKKSTEVAETQVSFSANLADATAKHTAAEGQALGRAVFARSAKTAKAATASSGSAAAAHAAAASPAASAQTTMPFAALVQHLVQEASSSSAPQTAAGKTTIFGRKIPKAQANAEAAADPAEGKAATGDQQTGGKRAIALAPAVPAPQGPKAAAVGPAKSETPTAEAGAEAPAQPKPIFNTVAAKAIDATGTAAVQVTKATPFSPKPQQNTRTASPADPTAAVQAAAASLPLSADAAVAARAKMDVAVAAAAMTPSNRPAAGTRTAANAAAGPANFIGVESAGAAVRTAQAATRSQAQALNVNITEIAQRAKAAAEEAAAAPLDTTLASAAAGASGAASAASTGAAAAHLGPMHAAAAPAMLPSPAEQIADAIPAAGVADGDRIVLRLTPPDLGTVRITFERDGDGVRGTVETDNPRTLVEIQRELAALTERMAANGVEVRKIDVQLSSQGERGASSGSNFTGGDGRHWQHEFRDGSEGATGDPPAGADRLDDSVNVYI